MWVCVCVCVMVCSSNLTWPESDWLVSGAGWGCTPIVHWKINVHTFNQPSPHTPPTITDHGFQYPCLHTIKNARQIFRLSQYSSMGNAVCQKYPDVVLHPVVSCSMQASMFLELFCPTVLNAPEDGSLRRSPPKSMGCTAGVRISEIICRMFQLYAYCVQRYMLCKGSCSVYYKNK